LRFINRRIEERWPGALPSSKVKAAETVRGPFMDRRRHPRSHTREEALVRDRSGRTIKATLLDTSARGARIAVEGDEQLPDVIELILPNGGRTYQCGVVWHIGGVYGLTRLAAGVGDGVLDLGSTSALARGAESGALLKARYQG
jgi:hypothetical protein